MAAFHHQWCHYTSQIYELDEKSVKLFSDKILNPWYSSMIGTKYTVCVITPCCYSTILKCTQHVCSLQNGLYFVNIYRNSTDINFPPVTYVYTVQMQQKKKKLHPLFWQFRLLIKKMLQSVTSFSSAEKFIHEGLSETVGQSKHPQSTTKVAIWNIIYITS